MKFIQNIYYRLSSNIIIAALGFIASVVVIRTFGVEIVGTIAFYMSIFGVMSCLCDLGVSDALIKFITDENAEEKDIIAAYFFLKIILLSIFLLFCSVGIYLTKETMDTRLMLTFFMTYLLGNGLKGSLYSICRARREFSIITIVELASNVFIFIYTIFICIFFKNIYLIALKLLLLYSLQTFFLVFYMVKNQSLTFAFPEKKHIMCFIKYARPIALTTFISNIMTHIDKLIIGNLIGMKELGFYDIAKRLFAPVDMLIKPVTSMLYPEILKRMYSKHNFFYTEFKEIVHILTCIGAIFSICIIFLSNPFVEIIYGSENLRAATIFTFFSGICLAKLFLRPYHHLIYGLELQYIYPYITIASSIIRITGYFWLIPQTINNYNIGAIAIPLINALTMFFPGGVIIWYKIRQKFKKTHIVETVIKICIPLSIVLIVGFHFQFHIWLFPFLLIAFIMIQIQLKIITKHKLTFIFQPILSVYNKFF